MTSIPEPPETEIVGVMRIACDGGEGALGHPRVWLSISHDTGAVECPYCDKKFIHEDWIEAAAPEELGPEEAGPKQPGAD